MIANKFIRNFYTTGYDLYKYGKIENVKTAPILRVFKTQPSASTINSKMYDMLNASSSKVYSKAKKDQFQLYINILTNDAMRLYNEADTDEEKEKQGKRYNRYIKNRKKFYKNQEDLR